MALVEPEFNNLIELSLGSQVTGYSNGTYTYRSGTDLNNENDNHGAHVAATVAGNTQGWKRC